MKSSYRIFCPNCTVNTFPAFAFILSIYTICLIIERRALSGTSQLKTTGWATVAPLLVFPSKPAPCRTCPPRSGEGFVLAQSSCLLPSGTWNLFSLGLQRSFRQCFILLSPKCRPGLPCACRNSTRLSSPPALPALGTPPGRFAGQWVLGQPER